MPDMVERDDDGKLHVFFDVDHTLVFANQHMNVLRPGAHVAMQTIKAAGHYVWVWSAGGKEYSERMVEVHGLSEWVDGCHDKSPRVQPKPDVIIDDDWFLVEKYGGYLVSQYKEVNHDDRELLDIIDKLQELGHL